MNKTENKKKEDILKKAKKLYQLKAGHRKFFQNNKNKTQKKMIYSIFFPMDIKIYQNMLYKILMKNLNLN